MDNSILLPGDEYDKQCGKIFLTTNGNVVFHCTLCEKKFAGFHSYFDHVYKTHYTPISQKKKTTAQLYEELNCFSYQNKSSEREETPVSENKDLDASDEEHPEIFEQVNFIQEMTVPNEVLKVEKSTKEKGSSSSEEESIKNAHKEESSDSDPEVKEVVHQPKLKQTNYEEKDRIFKCPHCEYRAQVKSYLREHIKRHFAKKPHKCKDCDKAFYRKSELISHTRTHTGERPYLCTDCGKGFTTSSMLLDHVKRHRNIKNKECDVCSQKFYNAQELRKHLAVHSEERPFICDVCQKGYKTRLCLKIHMKIHANKREHQCVFCGALFNHSSGLNSHIKNKHETAF